MRRSILILLMVTGLVAAACGGGGQAGGTEDGGNDSTDELSGSVVISGSSTVEPISARNAEKFAAQHPGVAISVDGPGTGDGFALFCDGGTDISDASRAIQDEEAETCASNGIEYVELQVAIDGITVMTSPQATELPGCLDFHDIYALVGPESTGFQSWADANDLAAEIGAGHAPYPDLPLVVTAPGEESGTYDSFVEIVLEGLAEERGQDATTRPDYQASANDNVIIEGVAGSPSSFGWVGYAFFVENQDAVSAFDVAAEPGGKCITPTDESIADGTYPISRPLFIYVNTQKAAENPALRAYVDFYLSEEGRASVSEVGYVQLTDEAWNETVSAWESR